MIPPDTFGRLIGHLNEEYIGLPHEPKSLRVAEKTKFGESNVVELFTKDGFWGGRKGEMNHEG